MKVEIIKKNINPNEWVGEAWLVKRGRKYYIISRTMTMDHGDETMVFASDEDGEVKSCIDLYTRRGCSHEDMITTMESDYDD